MPGLQEKGPRLGLRSDVEVEIVKLADNHRPWHGEDAPETCVECDLPWPCMDAYLDAKGDATRYRAALERIVQMDYRGNEPMEQSVAREALRK